MKKKQNIFSWIIVLVLLILTVYLFFNNNSLQKNVQSWQEYSLDIQKLAGIEQIETLHYHADFKVYLEGKQIDFSQQKYQLRSRLIHLENNNGDVIHEHAKGITLGHLFNTLGIKFTNECFTLETGKKFCNEENKKLEFYVNNELNNEYDNYEIRNKDKYLITYGDETEEEIENQLKTITDYSERAET